LVDQHPDCGAHIALQPTDDWLDPPLGEPLLYAGFYFETSTGLIPDAMIMDDAPVAAGLRDVNGCVGLHPNGRQVKCAKTLYLSAALAMGTTIEEQAENAAMWAAQAIEAISQIPRV